MIACLEFTNILNLEILELFTDDPALICYCCSEIFGEASRHGSYIRAIRKIHQTRSEVAFGSARRRWKDRVG
jgi:hypothetical protein